VSPVVSSRLRSVLLGDSALAFASLLLTGCPTRPTPGAGTDIQFHFDKYEIRPRDRAIPGTNARWLKANPKALVLVEGHCDERGTNEYNLALGQRRAQAFRDYLVATGVAGRRITIQSYGKERPLCTERTEGCWTRNRRAHFLVKW